jgi:hypothetical protein
LSSWITIRWTTPMLMTLQYGSSKPGPGVCFGEGGCCGCGHFHCLSSYRWSRRRTHVQRRAAECIAAGAVRVRHPSQPVLSEVDRARSRTSIHCGPGERTIGKRTKCCSQFSASLTGPRSRSWAVVDMCCSKTIVVACSERSRSANPETEKMWNERHAENFKGCSNSHRL